MSLGATAPSEEVNPNPFPPLIRKAQPKFSPPAAQSCTLWVTLILRVPLAKLATVTSAVVAASVPSVWMPLSPNEFQVDPSVQPVSMR